MGASAQRIIAIAGHKLTLWTPAPGFHQTVVRIIAVKLLRAAFTPPYQVALTVILIPQMTPVQQAIVGEWSGRRRMTAILQIVRRIIAICPMMHLPVHVNPFQQATFCIVIILHVTPQAVPD
nr:hypothetical protein PB20LOC_04375 [Pectobacterium parmentieri]